MNDLIASASKMVFVMMALTACVAFILRVLDTKDFMLLASMAFSFYFSSKGEAEKPYGGK